MGVGCALLLIVGTIYSLLYNDGRWVKNMDMSEYVFSYKDIPMLVIGALIALYAIYIVIICFKNVFSKNSREKRYSRTISPYWGFCGMFGFLGFGGFWTYYKFGEIFPFAFFIFFDIIPIDVRRDSMAKVGNRQRKTLVCSVNFLISQKTSFFKKINVRHNQKPTRQVLNYYLQLSGLWQQVCFPVMLSGVQYLC